MVHSAKQEAINTGGKKYFTGVPCKNGHIDFRYTNTGICYSCKREQVNRDYANNTKRCIATNKKSAAKNVEKVKVTKKNWVIKNRKKSNQIKKNHKLKNREKYLKYQRDYMKRKRLDPLFRLNKNTSKAIWASLKDKKGGRHWETLVKFTFVELVAHIEPKFNSKMTWENYGTYWELDHIKPISLCSSFEEAWQLNNLQPLECSINRGKCNRYIG